MKFPIRTLAIATVVLAAPVLASGVKPISIDYAGYGFNTVVDTIEDGMPVNISHADGKGTFGRSSIAITVEFVPSQDPIEQCPEGFPMHMWVVPDNYWAVTMTFPDLSQVFGLFNHGWICLTENRRFYVGEAYGAYVGGNGRFEGAEGEWSSRYEGVNLDPTIGFRSIKGDIEGFIALP